MIQQLTELIGCYAPASPLSNENLNKKNNFISYLYLRVHVRDFNGKSQIRFQINEKREATIK